MRAVIALAVIVLLLSLIGWVTFDADPQRPSATIEAEKIEQDLDQLGRAATDLGADAADSVDAAAETATDDDAVTLDETYDDTSDLTEPPTEALDPMPRPDPPAPEPITTG